MICWPKIYLVYIWSKHSFIGIDASADYILIDIKKISTINFWVQVIKFVLRSIYTFYLLYYVWNYKTHEVPSTGCPPPGRLRTLSLLSYPLLARSRRTGRWTVCRRSAARSCAAYLADASAAWFCRTTKCHWLYISGFYKQFGIKNME